MSPEQDNFQDLRRLLVLKRHEQPPPGYFEHFSVQVIARIHAGEVVRDTWYERLVGDSPWFHQLWNTFAARPVLAGGFSLAVCGLLVAGVIFSDDASLPPLAVLPVTEAAQPPGQLVGQPLLAPVVMHATPVGYSSTAGVLPQATAAIFQELKQAQRPFFQRVEQSYYVIPGGN